MHIPLQRSVLRGIEDHIGPTEQLLVGVRGAGKLGDRNSPRQMLFVGLVFGGILGSIFVHEAFAAITMTLVFLAILNAKPYALVLTDVSALVVRLSRFGRVLEVTRIDKETFPAARAWSRGDDSFLRIEMDPPLTISNPKMLAREHTYESLLVPLGIDTSEVHAYRKPRTRRPQRNG